MDGYELFKDRMNDYLARGKSEVLLPLIWDELEIVPTKVRSAIRLMVKPSRSILKARVRLKKKF